MNVPIGRLVTEVVRAMWSRPVWLVLTVAAAAALGAACACMVVTDSRAIDERQQRLLAQGWGLIAVSSASGDLVDPRVCTVVADVHGVLRVGAVGPTSEVGALGLAAGVGVTPVTADAVGIAWPQGDADAAALLTPGFVSLSGLDAGALYLNEGGASVAVQSEVVAGAGRYPALDGGVLMLRQQLTAVKYCLVDVPGEQAESLALDMAAVGVSYGVVAVPAMSRDDASPTPGDLVEAHRARHSALFAASFLVAVGALRAVRSRRDRAVYRLLAFGRWDLWTMGLLDYAICVAAPWSSAFAAVTVWAELRGVSTAVLGASDFTELATASAGVAFCYAIAWAAGRNRHQFAPGA